MEKNVQWINGIISMKKRWGYYPWIWNIYFWCV